MAWTVDTAHTSVAFAARHMGLAKVRGEFKSFNGEIEVDPSDLTTARGHLEIDMGSVDTGNEQRDGHLRSPDFFDVEKFPKMVFDTKSVTKVNDDRHKVVGDLTIKDVTHEVELDYEHGGEATDPYGNRKACGTLTGTINRSDWGLTWNVALETGGWLVSDKVSLEIDLRVAESQEAVEKEAEAQRATSA